MNDKNNIVLSLLTPRAGEWNYRYLVPSNCSLSDDELSQDREKLEQQSGENDGFLISDDVPQQGGRVGKEILIFYYEDFFQLPESARNTIHQILQKWFDDQRDSLLTGANWNAIGNASTIPFEALSALKSKIEQIIPGIVKEPPQPPKPLLFRRAMLLVVIAAVFASSILLVRACDKTPANPTDSQQPEQNGLVYKILKYFDELSTSPKPKNDEWKEYLVLFVWKPETEPDEDKLKEAFDDVWRARGDAPLGSLGDYLKGESVKGLRNKINNGEMPILGAVSEKDKEQWDILKGIDPVQFHEKIWALKQLIDNKGSLQVPNIENLLSQEISFYGEIDKNYYKNIPKFFISVEMQDNTIVDYPDLGHAKILLKFFNVFFYSFDKPVNNESLTDFVLKKENGNTLRLNSLDEGIKQAVDTLFTPWNSGNSEVQSPAKE